MRHDDFEGRTMADTLSVLGSPLLCYQSEQQDRGHYLE